MSKRYWIAVLILAGIALAGGALGTFAQQITVYKGGEAEVTEIEQPEQPLNDGSVGEPESRDQSNQIEEGGTKKLSPANGEPVIVSSSEEQVSSKPTPNKCDNGHENHPDCRDLAAQESMALSADETTRIGWSTFWLSLGGLVALFWTLYLTRSANKAAQDAVKVAQMNGEIELQPYLNFSNIKAALNEPRFRIDRGRMINIPASFRLYNTGKIPCYVRNVGIRQSPLPSLTKLKFIETPDYKWDENFKYIPAGRDVEITMLLRANVEPATSLGYLPIANIHFTVEIDIEFDDLFSLKRKDLKHASAHYAGMISLSAETNDYELSFRSHNSVFAVDDIHPSKRPKNTQDQSL